MTSVHVRGMAIDSEGEGPPIVMLHGLGGTSNSFEAMMPALSGFRVVRPDLPGAGRSPTPPQKITVASLVEAVEHAAVHLGVNRAHVVGHSFGTLIAQHIAARSQDWYPPAQTNPPSVAGKTYWMITLNSAVPTIA